MSEELQSPIEQRLAVEGRLRDNEARLRAVVETAVDAIITIDEKGVIDSLNPAALRMFGYSHEELLGKNVKSIMPAPYQAEHDVYLHNYLTTGERKVIGIGREVMGRRKDGSTFPIDLAVSEMIVGGRRMFTGIARDITDRKAAEDAAARLAAIVESSADAIIGKNLDGYISSWNAGAQRIFGYQAEEMIGRHITTLIPDDRQHEEQSILERLRRGELVAEFETKRLTRDGRIIDVAITASPIRNRQGVIIGASKIARDISERKKAAEKLIAIGAELQQKNQEKQEFFAILAHDLKHPVISIQGLLSLLKADVYDQLDEENKDNLRLSLSECGRMRDMLARINELGKIDHVAPRKEMVDLPRMLQGCIERFRPRLSPSGVSIRADVPPVTVGLSRWHVEEAVVNLLDNAINYGCPGGVGNIEVTARLEERICHITVRDQGPGIETRHHQRIFEPFRRLAGASAPAGSGIGLTAVRQLMGKIEGSVSLESEPGNGAAFSLGFPVD